MTFLYKKVSCENLKKIQEEVLSIIPEENRRETIYRSYQKEIFFGCKELYSYIELNGRWNNIDRISIISTKKFSKLPVHTDEGPSIKKTIYALNIPIINCYENYTSFYKVKKKTQTILKEQDHGDEYLSFDLDFLEEIDRLFLMDDVYWVNTQVPHGVTNDTDSSRIIISVRFENLKL
jgi:hypothetical protein